MKCLKWFCFTTSLFIQICFSQNSTPSQDPASGRVIWSATALPKTHKRIQTTVFDLGLWNVEGSIGDHIDVGVFAVVPLGFFAAAPSVRYHTSFSDLFHVGVVAQAGAAVTLYDTQYSGYFYGAGPVATYGNVRNALSVGLMTYGAGGFSNGFTDGGGFLILPNIAGSISVGDHVKFNLEAHSLNYSRADTDFGKVWAALYGVRIFSDSGKIFGDISFILPLASGVWEFYKYLPLGFPLINFGFSF